MKSSNLIVLIIALAIAAGGFAGINYLFTKVASGEWAAPALTLHA